MGKKSFKKHKFKYRLTPIYFGNHCNWSDDWELKGTFFCWLKLKLYALIIVCFYQGEEMFTVDAPL